MARFADITYRQMDHWTRQGYISPIGGDAAAMPGSGNPRDFTMVMARKARLMGCLVRVGFEPAVANKIAVEAALNDNKSLYLGHGITVLIEPHTH